MIEDAEKLRACIARFERLLDRADDPDLARVYNAEIAADRTMLAELERYYARHQRQPEQRAPL